MKLLCSPASPYSNKVRMAAHFLGLELNAIRVDTNTGPAILVDNNPLGKIPTLLTDDGVSIYDSVAIMHYFDRLTKGGLYPSKKGKRTDAEILEALCDGICDCLLAIVYERRFRDEEKFTSRGSTGSGRRRRAVSRISAPIRRKQARSSMADISRWPRRSIISNCASRTSGKPIMRR